MYNVLEICSYIINYSNEKEYDISNLKLQKLLYFIQVYFLIKNDEPCFEEKIEAWDFGPVVPIAYNQYKQYGSMNIPPVTMYIDRFGNNPYQIKRIEYDNIYISKNDRKMINNVIDKLADYTATDLVAITQNQAPWREVHEDDQHNEITHESLIKYFYLEEK